MSPLKTSRQTSPAAPEPRGGRLAELSEDELEQSVDFERLPRHIAVIPDGNGRWARLHGKRDRVAGHEAGVKSIQALVEETVRLKIPALSIYAFSLDNWSRSRHETSTLMHFLQKFLVDERPRLEKHQIRLMHSGRREDLPKYVLRALDRTLEMTADNGGMIVNLAVSYSGRYEILRAARLLVEKAARGELGAKEVTPDLFRHHLYQPDLGDPDLLIRTSGESRISDFLLYQASYAELYFTPVLWPDFRRRHLLEAILDYQSRSRRFGREE